MRNTYACIFMLFFLAHCASWALQQGKLSEQTSVERKTAIEEDQFNAAQCQSIITSVAQSLCAKGATQELSFLRLLAPDSKISHIPNVLWSNYISPAAGVIGAQSTRVFLKKELCKHVRSAQYSPNGKRIMIISHNGLVSVHSDEHTSKSVPGFHVADEQDTGAKQSRDSSKKITQSASAKDVVVWQMPTEELFYILRGHTAKITSTRFSPDDSMIVTASKDRTARLWNAKNGNQQFVLHGHRAPVSLAVFSDDSSALATASNNGQLMLWHTGAGNQLAALQGPQGKLLSMSFSPNGASIVITLEGGPVIIWDVFLPVTSRQLTLQQLLFVWLLQEVEHIHAKQHKKLLAFRLASLTVVKKIPLAELRQVLNSFKTEVRQALVSYYKVIDADSDVQK